MPYHAVVPVRNTQNTLERPVEKIQFTSNTYCYLCWRIITWEYILLPTWLDSFQWWVKNFFFFFYFLLQIQVPFQGLQCFGMEHLFIHHKQNWKILSIWDKGYLGQRDILARDGLTVGDFLNSQQQPSCLNTSGNAWSLYCPVLVAQLFMIHVKYMTLKQLNGKQITRLLSRTDFASAQTLHRHKHCKPLNFTPGAKDKSMPHIKPPWPPSILSIKI